jgi:anti-anti-sigma factor
MNSAHATARHLAAPERLGLDTRVEFRKAAVQLLEQLPEGAGELVIDLKPTRHVDSAGLGVLMLIQRRAAERRQTVVLQNPSDELRFLLVLTKLVDLFRLDVAA